jgi:hypothetical protein
MPRPSRSRWRRRRSTRPTPCSPTSSGALELTRWPEDAGNQGWSYGVHRAYLQELVDYWRTGYDWRAAEAAINAYQHYRVQVEGVPGHFLRRPGVGPDRCR